MKNDAEAIQSCLNTLTNIVDCVCICDLGSRDKTVAVVEEFLRANGIPGGVYPQRWRNFSHNKTLSMQTAQAMVKDLGYSLDSTYLLVLNPDSRLVTEPTFCKEALTDDVYLLSSRLSKFDLIAFQPHLFRASFPWNCTGMVQEAWDGVERFKNSKLQTLRIYDELPPNAMEELLQKEVKRLMNGAKSDPANLSYSFYLGLIHRNLNSFDEAIKWFYQRIQKEEKREEVWFSKLMIGECYEKKGEWDHAINWYLEAYEANPTRGEPLHRIAKGYQNRFQNDLAYLFAKQGSELLHGPDPTLLTTTPFNRYEFNEDLSISAYYTAFKEDGFTANNELVLSRTAPENVKNQAYYNFLYYAKKLENTEFSPISVICPLIKEGSDTLYHPLNPSIRKTEEGYEVICRTANYVLNETKYFHIQDEDSVFRTRNFLLKYDRQFNLISQEEIVEALPRDTYPLYWAEGLEDCRIFELNGQPWFTCTTPDTNPCGNLQVSLCKLSEEGIEGVRNVESLIPLLGPDPYRCEKNWLPFVKDSELYMIYSYSPFMIYKPDMESGECTLIHYVEPAEDLSRFRGSAAPIEFDGGYLLMVHEAIAPPGANRFYLHRFVVLDKDLTLRTISKPFNFEHFGVEFCCGMVIDHEQERLIMSIGIEDAEAKFCMVPLGTVRSLINTFDSF